MQVDSNARSGSAARKGPRLNWALSDKAKVWEAVHGRWAGAIGPDERAVLSRILLFTMSHDWPERSLTMKCFVEGRPQKETDRENWGFGPLGLSVRKVQGCLKVLRERGLVDYETAPGYAGITFRPNLDFIIAPWTSVPLPPRPPKPSMRKDAQISEAPGPASDAGPPAQRAAHPRTLCRQDRTFEETHLKKHLEREAAASGVDRSRSSSFNFSEDIREDLPAEPFPPKSAKLDRPRAEPEVAAAVERNATNQAIKLLSTAERVNAAVPGLRWSKGSPRPPNALRIEDVRQIWEEAWTDRYSWAPEAPGWREKERGLIYQLFDTFPRGRFAEFLSWVVQNWSAVISSAAFNWMETRPQHPELAFLVRWEEQFADAWMRRAKEKQRASASDFDKLLMSGKSGNQAAEELVGRERKYADRRLEEVERRHKIGRHSPILPPPRRQAETEVQQDRRRIKEDLLAHLRATGWGMDPAVKAAEDEKSKAELQSLFQTFELPPIPDWPEAG